MNGGMTSLCFSVEMLVSGGIFCGCEYGLKAKARRTRSFVLRMVNFAPFRADYCLGPSFKTHNQQNIFFLQTIPWHLIASRRRIQAVGAISSSSCKITGRESTHMSEGRDFPLPQRGWSPLNKSQGKTWRAGASENEQS